jgi:VWFA-related protein
METTAAARTARRIRQIAPAVAVAALLAAAALPARGEPAKQSFTEATEVLAIEVPVQVLDRNGEPVRGLTAADFTVWDGREQQPVTGFETLDLSSATPATTGAATPAAEKRKEVVPPSARRRFVLLFDLTFSSGASLVKGRQAARTLLAGLHPSDLVAVATYSASRGPELLLGFTADHRQAVAALDHLGSIERAADPLRLTLPESGAGRAEGMAGSRHGGEDGGGAGSGLDINAVVNAAAERAAFDAQRRDVTAFSRAVGAFAKVMGSVHGRKYVIFLSEGFSDRLFLGTDDDEEIQRMNEASAAGRPWEVNSDVRYGNTKLSTEIEKMTEELRRADCVVESVDSGGLRAYGGENGIKPATGQNSLFVMARNTGGELYNNFNDLSVAMHEMLKRTSVTYVLTYQPEGVKHDGEYHRLKVELKNPQRGQRVVYRPGYYAPKPFKDQDSLERMLDAESRVVSGQEGGALSTSVLAAPFQGPGDKAYVPVLIEVDGESLLAGKQGNALPVEIYTYAMDQNGTVQDFFAKTLGLDLAKVEPALRESGLKFYGDLSLAPGSYSLRVLVRNGATGALNAKVVPLEVPAFAQASTVLLPPFFPEKPGRWLLVRENNEAPKGVTYPFQEKSGPFIPAALPVLHAGEDARIALVGYHLRPGVLKADSQILTADGQEAGAGDIKVVDREAGAPGSADAADRLEATFRTPDLQPGEYLLLVTLTDATGRAETTTASFVVGKGVHG